MKKKLFFLICVMLFLSIIYSMTKVVNATEIPEGEFKIYGNMSEHPPLVKQNYETWCVYAVLQAGDAGLQEDMATKYVNDFLNPPIIINCMFVDYEPIHRRYCVNQGAVLLENLPHFVANVNSRFSINTGLAELFEHFTYTRSGYLPCMALLPYAPDCLHAIYLYCIIIPNNNTETCILEYMDPWIGESRTRIASRTEEITILQ